MMEFIDLDSTDTLFDVFADELTFLLHRGARRCSPHYSNPLPIGTRCRRLHAPPGSWLLRPPGPCRSSRTTQAAVGLEQRLQGHSFGLVAAIAARDGHLIRYHYQPRK